MQKIVIIDYGSGNLLSVKNALNYIGFECVISNDKKIISNSDILILPGVGSFYNSMLKLNKTGLADIIKENINIKKKKILGICLGMQLLASLGTEDKKINGLSFVDGEVISLKNLTNFKLPHIGFNRVLYDKNSVLFKGLGDKTFFYFIHSFFLKSQSKRFRFSYCEYGKKFISSFEFENIFGTQFHPEKSQKNGLKVLENFIKYD